MATSINSKNIKIYNAKNFRNSISGNNSSNIFVTVGKSSPWPNDSLPSSTDTSVVSENQYWRDMIGGKRIVPSDISHAIPRQPWITGRRYAQYGGDVDSNILKSSGTNFYVITGDRHVFKCLSNNYSAQSTVMPSQTTPTAPDFQTADGYIWKYMYTVSPSDLSRFGTGSFTPVKTLLIDDSSAQWQVQNSAISGAIHHIQVTNGGINYSTQNARNYLVRSYGANTWLELGGTNELKGGLYVDDSPNSSPVGANTYPQRSWNLWAIERSNGNVVLSRNFDLYGEWVANVANVTANVPASNSVATQEFANTLNSLQSDKVVVLQTWFDPTPYRGLNDLGPAMYRCGASREVFGNTYAWTTGNYSTDTWRHGAAYILVGVPGIGEGRGFEKYAGIADASANVNGSPLWNNNSNTIAELNFYITESDLKLGRSNNDTVVVISGDGSGATAYPVINNVSKTIKSIVVTNRGSGYTFANVTINSTTTGSGATAKASISPPGGHGADPVVELGGSYLSVNPQINGTEGGIISAANDFRQVGIIEQPKKYGSEQVSSNLAFSQLTVLTVASGDSGFVIDEYVYQSLSEQSTFSGVVSEWDSANNTLKLSNVLGTPTVNEPIIGRTSNGLRIITSYQNPDLQPYSGKLLYINNIPPVSRDPDQIDDFKIILSF